MGENLDTQIRKLQEFYWSDADPEGRGFVSLAELYRRAGDLPEAHRLLRDGLARHARLASGHVVLGWVYLDQGSPTEAEAAFRAALSVDSENLGALRGLGELLLEREEPREALTVHRKLERLDPLDRDVPKRLRELEARTEALARSPELLSENTEQGVPVWEDGGEIAESLDWDRASVQEDLSPEAEDEPPAILGPTQGKDSLVTRTMGEIYLRQGLLDEARRVFETLLEEDPENELLRTRLREVDAAEKGAGQESGPSDDAPPPGLSPVGTLEEALGGGDLPASGLRPDEVTPIQELGPDSLVPITALAPGSVIPVAELAPDIIVPVAQLAPEAILSVGDLAPDTILPIQELAPDARGPGSTLEDSEARSDRLP